MYRGGGLGRGDGLLKFSKINLLRTWGVDIESRIRPENAAYARLLWLLLERYCLSNAWLVFGNFRPEVVH